MRKLLILLMAVFVSVALAERAATPNKEIAQSQGVKQVSLNDAKALLNSGAVFLDARKPVDIARGKIKGALKATYTDKGGNKNKIVDWNKSKDKYFNKNFPTNKDASIVTYCNGPKCWKSYKLAVVLVKDLGYTNVNWLRDGYPTWSDEGLPTE